MRIVEWFRKKWHQGKALTLEELREELRVTQEQIHIGTEIAKANPDHPQLWDSVFFRVDEMNRLNKQIKQLEENK